MAFSLVYRFSKMHSTTFRALLVILALALGACSSNKYKDDELTEQEYYQQAQKSLESENFFTAVEKLKLLESRYPFGRYSEQAQLEMMYAYFKLSDLEHVLATTERFIRLHPLHEQVDYAYYMRALSTYEMAFPFVERFSNDMVQRDPTALKDAFYYFSELLIRFPDSPHIADARAHMVYIKDRLAAHEIYATHYLMKRHSFAAAANRATGVLLNFQGTTSVPEALALQVEAFREMKMEVEADQALAILKQNYPDYHQFEDGEFIESGLAMVDRHSFWNIVSFGLID